MSVNEKQVALLRFAAEARLTRADLGRLAPARRGAATASSAGAGSVPTWKDGSPRDPELAILSRFDEERFRVDPEYQSRPEVQKDAARLLVLREAKRGGVPADKIVIGEAEAAAMLYDEKVKQLDDAIAEFEARKSAIPAPEKNIEEKEK